MMMNRFDEARIIGVLREQEAGGGRMITVS